MAVGAIVIANVVGGGMRSITFVQAFQYWLKLTAIAIPALALLALFFADRRALGGPMPPTVEHDHGRDRNRRRGPGRRPGGITVTGTLDGTPVDATARSRRPASTRWAQAPR